MINEKRQYMPQHSTCWDHSVVEQQSGKAKTKETELKEQAKRRAITKFPKPIETKIKKTKYNYSGGIQ